MGLTQHLPYISFFDILATTHIERKARRLDFLDAYIIDEAQEANYQLNSFRFIYNAHSLYATYLTGIIAQTL